MNDNEISAAEARRLLSLPSRRGPCVGRWNRRRFLQAVGLGVGAGLTITALGEKLLGHDVPEAWAGSPIAADDGILVNILMYGGNDGLNTVVPYTNALYYGWRSGGTSIAVDSVLPLDASFGLHPSLATVKSLWDSGEVAIVHGVGYRPADLSHFASMAIWMNGSFTGRPNTGWLGRWLDGQPAATAELAAASIGTSVPLHLIGATRRALGVPQAGGMLGSTTTDDTSVRVYTALTAMSASAAGRGLLQDMYASTVADTIRVAGELAPALSSRVTGGEFTQKLTMAARLINRDVGLRVLDVGVGSFDTHHGERGRHAALLADLDAGIQAFFATLDPSFRSRVTLMTASEFGRTVQGNNSLGTDHGTANAHFVIGENVRGGMYGQPPSLAGLGQWDRLVPAVDFRSMYGTILDGWMGGGGSTIIGGAFENLELFSSPPGGPTSGVASQPIPGPSIAPVVTIGPAEPLPASAPAVETSGSTEYVPLSPRRVVDTRDGSGGRTGALQPNEPLAFQVAGLYGVPADAVAIAFNVTAAEATGPTFLTVWGTGAPRPSTSNLNPVPGLAVPNLVVARPGAGGSVSIYNLKSTVHVVVDLVGYFRPGSSSGLLALDPRRVLDTRFDGARSKVGPGGLVELLIAGTGAIPASATAVALNVTVTEPDSGSYLLVYPSGETRPNASSINMERGQTVANMVIAKLGTNGMISIYNLAGNTHIVVDVLGCFVPAGSGHFVALGPARVLDTRDGTGTLITRRVGQVPLSLSVSGTAGIPSTGVAAVLLNVTAVEPSADTFITVFPGGAALPNASNLNATAGQIVPNMVLARLGPDGDVQLFNFAGDVDLVVDVFGYFTS